MGIITLTTDRNIKDFFLGRVKGEIYKECPSAVIVDLAHGIEAFNINQAAFVLKNSYKHFPANTIHLIGVDSEKGISQNHLIVKTDNQYFIGADNGVFSLIFNSELNEIYSIKSNDNFNKNKPALIEFVNIASKILNGINIEEIAEKTNRIKRKFLFEPGYENDVIMGNVIYIDSYLNVVSNISKELFEKVRNGRDFKITVGSSRNIITKINKQYQEVKQGEMLAIFNSLGYLEVAVNKGRVAEMMNFDMKTSLKINFYD
jgi:hypothetical protein